MARLTSAPKAIFSVGGLRHSPDAGKGCCWAGVVWGTVGLFQLNRP
jgi:hypothetical protein